MSSIRVRLLMLLVPALTASVVVGGVVLYLWVQALLVTRLDAALESKVRMLASHTVWAPEGLDFDFEAQYVPEFAPGPEAEYFEIHLDEHGGDGGAGPASLRRSPSLGDQRLNLPEQAGDQIRACDTELPDGRPGRIAALRFHPGLDTDDPVEPGSEEAKTRMPAETPLVTVIVARSRREVDAPLQALMTALVGSGALTIAAASALVIAVVRGGLLPLQRVGAAVEAIDDSSLSTRLAAAEVPAELRGVCDKLNELLARLEAAFGRERRFSSAAAHELRTPVAELRTAAEVALKWPGDAVAQSQALNTVVDVSQQMERMISTLLALARSQRGEILPQNETLAVRAMIDATLGAHAALVERKRLTCRSDVPAALRVQADRAILTSILANLVDNAVEHAPEGGKIRITAERRGDETEIVISNTNPGLRAEELPRVFEPYWRRDAARSDRAHSGLGLALVRELADAAGMRVAMSLTASGELEARLTLKSA
jgi:two-component system sensor histidine kinase QseC